MEVYLIPVGDDRYELYCEHVVEEEALNPDVPAGSGRFAAMCHRFNAAIARVEREQQDGVPTTGELPAGWRERMTRRMLCWIAEKIVEWRLLWRLRKEAEVSFFFPDDLTGAVALATSRTMLKRDADHHLKWTIIDGLLFCASGIVAVVPGPNLLAYYFGFRLAGHFLSWRGAKHGLDQVRWHGQPTAQLTLLRQAIPLEAHEREQHVQNVASALDLRHLAAFFERTAIPAA
jgi:hypothetical protein